jgi:WhiB family redox-sensing transcriptional regulator
VSTRNPLWHLDAACLDTNPEVFYPLDLARDSSGVTAAKQICAGCPVRGECLADVMAAEDPARRWGISGGTTPTERTALFARRNPAPVRGAA